MYTEKKCLVLRAPGLGVLKFYERTPTFQVRRQTSLQHPVNISNFQRFYFFTLVAFLTSSHLYNYMKPQNLIPHRTPSYTYFKKYTHITPKTRVAVREVKTVAKSNLAGVSVLGNSGKVINVLN